MASELVRVRERVGQKLQLKYAKLLLATYDHGEGTWLGKTHADHRRQGVRRLLEGMGLEERARSTERRVRNHLTGE